MSTPTQFFDPFFSGPPEPPAFRAPGRRGPSIPDTKPPTSGTELPVTGQGTIAISTNATETLKFKVSTTELEKPTLFLRLDTSGYQLYYQPAKSESGEVPPDVHIPAVVVRGNIESCTIDSGVQTVYWFSIDHNNGILRYGKNLINKSMTLLEAKLKKKDEKDGIWVWEDKKLDWLDKVKKVTITQDSDPHAQDAQKIKILPLPVVLDRSPFVRRSEQISLQDLECGLYTVAANLPAACQMLYENVYGVELEDGTFPFAKAIQYSCTTKGCWGYETLWKKARKGEFGHDIDGTYLRITLGYNLGDSPGVPYVMEIWPSKHFSPIHDHGTACAVIKVLHGEITATYYSELRNPYELGNPAILKQGGITWLGEQNYQIHKLHNTSDDVCVTIQCYRYDDNQNVHDDVFRFPSGGLIKDFIPNSDSTFGAFKAKMKEEWECRVRKTAAINI